MQQITQEEALGKTVVHIWHNDDDAVFLFADDTWLHLHLGGASQVGEDACLEFPPMGELELHDQRDAGLISSEEFTVLRDKERQQWALALEVQERRQYERLRAKYEQTQQTT